MDRKEAKAQTEKALRPFVGQELTTEALNQIEDAVNFLILEWSKALYFIHDGRGNLVRGIKIWYDLHDGSLKFRFRYPATIINMGAK